MSNALERHRRKIIALSTVDGAVFFVSRVAFVASLAWATVYFVTGYYTIGAVAAGVSPGMMITILMAANDLAHAAKHTSFFSAIFGVFLSGVILPVESHIGWFGICTAAGAVLMFESSRDRMLMIAYVILSAGGIVAPYILQGLEVLESPMTIEFAAKYVSPFVAVSLFAVLTFLSFWFNGAVRSQIKKLEAARREAQELSAAKSDFLATMSHELRTPMNGIVGMVDLLLQGNLGEGQRRMMDTVQESSRELLYVIDDLVDAASMEAGRFSPRSEAVNIREVLGDSLDAIRPLAGTNGVPLEIKIDDTLPACVMGDANRLRQVIMNLLHNAVKFSQNEDGNRSGPVVLSAENNDDEILVLCVEDHGIGMSADMIARLFRPFVQREEVQSRRFGGMGLGLAICHRLVHLMGGTLFVESRLGQGSKFYIQLPLQEVQREGVVIRSQGQEDKSPNASRIKGKILVVEDNKINRLVVQQQLNALGCRADLAVNGYDGLQRWRSGEYDLVLSDCHMPEMNGLEMAATIRAEEHEKDLDRTPIVAITASTLPQQEIDCRAAGMDGFLTKPVRLDELSSTLANWIGWEEEVKAGNEPGQENVVAFKAM